MTQPGKTENLKDTGPADKAADTSPAPGDDITGLRAKIVRLIEGAAFSSFIIIIIAINAVTLGLETWPAAVEMFGGWLKMFDRAALAIYVIELCLKIFAYGPRFFSRGWNLFDFVIVAIALVPAAEGFSVLRAFRILRALRLLSVVPQMRAVIGALLTAVPGMGAIVAVLTLVFYIAAVMATKLFGAAFPQWFGTVGGSMFSLFQIMTLESWSMGIVRPVMVQFPWAWVFFVPFIIVTSFAVLNLFIALIVNSLQVMHEEEMAEMAGEAAAEAHEERDELMAELKALRADVKRLSKVLRDRPLD